MPSFSKNLLTILPLVATTIPIWLWIRRRNERLRKDLELLRLQRLVVITGCDSGLGFAMAYWAAEHSYKVLAGCYSLESAGVQSLQKFPKDVLHICELDVTKPDSIDNFRDTCQHILSNNATRLWALIPNAAVGCFGEFSWMTDPLCRRIFEVNFWGGVNLVQTFHPLILRYKSRIIVITSDCADFPLPGLSMYSASKAALQTWANSLRLEFAKFGVAVTCFQPGNFPTKSRLFAGQSQAFEEMKSSMTEEDRQFYGEYFIAYNTALIGFLESTSEQELKEDQGLRMAVVALLGKDLTLVPIESRNDIVLALIHFGFKYLPVRGSDWLKSILLKTPKWQEIPYPASV